MGAKVDQQLDQPKTLIRPQTSRITIENCNLDLHARPADATNAPWAFAMATGLTSSLAHALDPKE